MNKTELPANFTMLNKGNVTLYIRKEYEHRLTAHDMDMLFSLCKDGNKLDVSYHGRTPCKTFSMESIKDESFVVKEYWHGGLFGRVLRDLFWNGSRPLRELSICEAAKKSGIKTTEIVAIVKNKIMGPFFRYQLVSKEITNAIDLIVLLSHPEDNQLFAQKRQIINKLAKAVKEMHDAGIYHADLHLKNILVQLSENGSVDVYIIDLDKSEQYEEVDFRIRMKNIMRLDRSLEKLKRNVSGIKDILITDTDKMRFLREYIKLSYRSEQHSYGSQKEFLKSCLMNYQTTHRSHRFWWSVVNGKCKGI